MTCTLTESLWKATSRINNNRLYPGHVLEREAEKFKQLIDEKRAVGELDHPDSLTINLDRVSHFIENLDRSPGTSQWLGRLKLMDTPFGRIGKELIEAGVQLAISSRGVGSLTENEDANVVGEDYNLITYDLVHSPGAPNAFLSIKESKEYIYENGKYIPYMSIFDLLPEFRDVESHNTEEYADEMCKMINKLKFTRS